MFQNHCLKRALWPILSCKAFQLWNYDPRSKYVHLLLTKGPEVSPFPNPFEPKVTFPLSPQTPRSRSEADWLWPAHKESEVEEMKVSQKLQLAQNLRLDSKEMPNKDCLIKTTTTTTAHIQRRLEIRTDFTHCCPSTTCTPQSWVISTGSVKCAAPRTHREQMAERFLESVLA